MLLSATGVSMCYNLLKVSRPYCYSWQAQSANKVNLPLSGNYIMELILAIGG
jgi:hypothetical protein